ncbi:Nif3-like dinuclear metal center hexameric protein [Anaerostipes sp.]|uniref:Nif3-like dinuclear metal center hexameric protein n=1 Tax=Anaerostipes sp. TaxID=1872530 RepID=UPI0025C0C43F|nr:Nif3-like dinuclear metal center hexameric protein [Anaerostipes sp.]MBS7007620.1 Nif3-like dinuclear metal center hexameric protein [Anaerostipes sp.]
MKYSQLKGILTGMFDSGKLQMLPQEWGFYNEIEREIRCIGYATNLTREIIEQASRERVDFLITHHDSWEFIYGLKKCCNRLLDENKITHAFFHAPLDDADFGTSASLAKALGIRNIKKVMPYAEVYYGGVTGEINPVSFDLFSNRLADVLQENIRCFRNSDQLIKKVAVAAGGGNMTSEMKIASEAGCDTYVTGEYVLYSQQYAQHVGMNLFVGSHTNTEILGVESLVRGITKGTDIRLVRIKEPNY